jgi:tetratricopeptide (TPR) repeat protein
VPADADICVCTDLDEVLETGWREKLERVWMPGVTHMRYMYTWCFNADGTRGHTFWYEKIHSRKGYRWVHPVHEVLRYYGDAPEVWANAPDIQLDHYPDPGKSRGQYLPLLELSHKENPQDNATAFWLGREYMYRGQYDAAIKTLQEHLAMPGGWDMERCASMRYIARCLQAKGDIAGAKGWLYRAIAESPGTREPYTDMARLGYALSDWQLTYCMAEMALRITEKPVAYLTEEASWDYSPYDLGAIAGYRIGLYERAKQLALRACALRPDDQRLKNNLTLIEEKCGEAGS